MNIALLGYGKMGKEIEQIAINRNHTIVLKVDESNSTTFTLDELKKADVAIEFSTPESAVNNIYKCFEANVPVVIGTTGWLNRLEEVKSACMNKQQGMLHASNFSIGVNVFFEINKRLAELMNPHPEYDVKVEEIHHIHKLDAPSGTAISIANDILSKLERKEKWVNNSVEEHNKNLEITSIRTDSVPGTHIVKYESDIDYIEIQHVAHNRKGFALGAVIAAEWIKGKKGTFAMSDVLKLNS